ncbi:YebC/PmpR family DNA-binding transcriptional regulator [Mycoplasmatota bacterium]|nr:YebC/PmpR family DNA-binding transcriptional regulator [Mycoplasmatota bacterium]
MGRAFEVRKAAMAKTSAAKTKVYSRFGKEIYIAAKAGVPDPEMNLTLKHTIEKAKKAQVPADIIKRAIEKASSGTTESYTSVRYEGFGPGQSTFIVDCLTDNVNRTVSEVRNCFTKTKNKMGVSGSVSFMYNNNSIVSFTGLTEDETLEALINAEIDADIEAEDDVITVYGEPSDLYKIKTSLEEVKPEIKIDIEEISMIPMNYIKLETNDEKENFNRLVQMLNELDDVQEIYHNVELD